MPVDKQVLLRYQVLNRCLRNKYREYTIDDLVDECNKALRRMDKPDVSKRTIQKDLNAIEADYHILLDENLRQGHKRVFRYADINQSIPLYNINDEERNKIDDAIRVMEQYEGEPVYDWARACLKQIFSGHFGDGSSDVVTFQTNLDLKGLHHFDRLLQAILAKRVLKLKYTPFGKPQLTATVYPYHLKEFNERWYLIAQVKGYETYSHYALDRIDGFEEVAIPYKEPETDFSEYFDNVVGVTVPRGESEKIILRVSKPRFEYIRTKPLHLSQHLIEETDDYAVISINVIANKELESLVLYFGRHMEVLAPEPFRQKIADTIQSLSEKYANCEENLHS